MNDNSRKLMIAVPALCLLVLAGWCGSRFLSGFFISAAVGSSDQIDQSVKEITGYRNWTKVNAEPQLMEMQTAQLCAMVLTRQGVDVNGPTNPHHQKYITVYVNETGRKAMVEQAKPKFPVGSVIVKEKLSEPSSQTPELLTVMIKREKGFNPESGDWEYMAVDGTGRKIEARGKLKNCQGCHLANGETDYIFRTYLSRQAVNKLK